MNKILICCGSGKPYGCHYHLDAGMPAIMAAGLSKTADMAGLSKTIGMAGLSKTAGMELPLQGVRR
jgi:hypothetical protein